MTLEQLLTPIEPPPGGLQRLRADIRGTSRRGHRFRNCIAATAVLFLAVFGLWQEHSTPTVHQTSPALAQHTLVPRTEAGSDVVFYWVM